LEVYLEQVRQLYGAIPLTVVSVLAGAGVLAAVLWPLNDPRLVLSWLFVVFLVTAARIVLAQAFKRSAPASDDIERWGRYFVVGTFASGITWGGGSIILFPEGATEYQAFIAFMLGGLAAGAVTTLAILPIAFFAFLVPALLPLLVLFFTEGTSVAIGMGAMTLVYFLMITLTSRRVADSYRESIVLRLESAARERSLWLSEKRNRSLVDSVADALLVHDRDGQVLDVNQQACRVLGYARDELLRLTMFDLISDIGQQQLADVWQSTLATRKGKLECTYHRKDGSRFAVEATMASYEDAERTLVLTLARDISERLDAERRMRRAKEEAEKASRAKSEFLSSMSHELRTPLNAILGFAQLLDLEGTNQNLTTEQYASVRDILDAGHHLLALIEDVLNLAQIEAGKLDLEYAPVDLGELLSACRKLIQPQAEQRRVAVLYDPRQLAGQRMYCDATRVKQVLLNLLSNAVKYNRRDGTGTVTVECREVDGGRLRLSVEDNGFGIPEDEQNQLFLPFSRLKGSRSAAEGTGIGLTVSKRLVETMGGSIGMESRDGEGCTFWFELPMSVDSV